MFAFFNSLKTKKFAKRSLSVALVLAVLAAFCLGELVSIQLINGKSMAAAAAKGRTLTVPIHSRRGKILDTNGAVLAQSLERYTIVADPVASQEFKPTDCTKATKSYCQSIDGKPVGVDGAAAVARLIAPVLGMSAMDLGAKLSVQSRYLILAKDVAPEVKRSIDKLNLAGAVYGELSEDRVYTNGTMMGALLGGVDDKEQGASGIEQMENKLLDGTDGYKQYQQGNGGEEIPGTMTKSKDAKDGSDVHLTIDSDVDWYVKKVLTDGKQQYNADWGIAAVEDVKTHQIIALDDSDQIVAGSPDAKLNVSRAVNQTFEPGSIGKVFSLAGMLQLGLHQLTDQFTVPDHIDKKGQVFKDSTDHGLEHWTLAGILQESSNVGMVMASDKYTDADRYDFLTKFGIGESSGLNLPGESRGTLTNPQSWDGRTRDTVLFGQGYATNILQLTNAITTVADGGVFHKQQLVKSVTNPDGHVESSSTDEGTRVIDKQVSEQLLNAMESAADHYQKFASVQGYRIAAKSGTAEVRGNDGKLSSIVSDWAGVIPADNPRFVVTVVLKNPQGAYGGMTAGPLFKQIAEFLMQKYEVPTSTPRTDAIPTEW